MQRAQHLCDLFREGEWPSPVYNQCLRKVTCLEQEARDHCGDQMPTEQAPCKWLNLTRAWAIRRMHSLMMHFELVSRAGEQMPLVLYPLDGAAIGPLFSGWCSSPVNMESAWKTHLFLLHPNQRCGTQFQRERGHWANIQSSHIWIPEHSDHPLALT